MSIFELANNPISKRKPEILTNKPMEEKENETTKERRGFL
jgi:hypothetical protein